MTKTDIDIIDAVLSKRIDSALSTHLKPIQEDISRVRKDQKTIVNFFDREYLDLRQRVDKIEDFLKLYHFKS